MTTLRRRLHVGGVALLFVLAGCANPTGSSRDGAAAPGPTAPPVIGPHTSAAQILAARPRAAGEEWRATYRVTEGEGGPREVVVGLGPDYLLISEGPHRTIVDRALRRRIEIEGDQFANTSLYAMPAFAAYEIQNRAALRRVMNAAGQSVGIYSLDQFWAEADLGVTTGGPAVQIEAAPLPSGGSVYSYRGTEVARFSPSDRSLPAVRGELLRLFLQHRLRLHPSIRDAIVATGRMPQEIAYSRPVALELRQETWQLTVFEQHPAAYALPPSAGPVIRADAFFEREILPSMLAAVEAHQPPRSLDQSRRAAVAAADRGNWADAMLIVMETSLQYGVHDCPPPLAARKECLDLAAHRSEMMADLGAAAFVQATGIQYRDSAQAIRLWRGMSRSGLSNPTLIDLMIANTLSSQEAKPSQAEAEEPTRLFASALRGNPFIASIYKDIGDHYMRRLAPLTAWIAYDLGRAVPGRPANDNLAKISALERLLEQQHPAFF